MLNVIPELLNVTMSQRIYFYSISYRILFGDGLCCIRLTQLKFNAGFIKYDDEIDGDIAFGRQLNRPPRRSTEKSLAESFMAEC